MFLSLGKLAQEGVWKVPQLLQGSLFSIFPWEQLCQTRVKTICQPLSNCLIQANFHQSQVRSQREIQVLSLQQHHLLRLEITTPQPNGLPVPSPPLPPKPGPVFTNCFLVIKKKNPLSLSQKHWELGIIVSKCKEWTILMLFFLKQDMRKLKTSWKGGGKKFKWQVIV